MNSKGELIAELYSTKPRTLEINVNERAFIMSNVQEGDEFRVYSMYQNEKFFLFSDKATFAPTRLKYLEELTFLVDKDSYKVDYLYDSRGVEKEGGEIIPSLRHLDELDYRNNRAEIRINFDQVIDFDDTKFIGIDFKTNFEFDSPLRIFYRDSKGSVASQYYIQPENNQGEHLILLNKFGVKEHDDFDFNSITAISVIISTTSEDTNTYDFNINSVYSLSNNLELYKLFNDDDVNIKFYEKRKRGNIY